MALDIKICDLNEAPNLAFGWADAIVSIADSQGSSRPDFSHIKPHHVMVFDNITDEDDDVYIPVNDDMIIEMLEFVDTLGENDKLLVHSHSSTGRASSIAYVILAYNGASPALALSNTIALMPEMELNMLVIATGEHAMYKDTRLTKFINKWKNLQSTVDDSV